MEKIKALWAKLVALVKSAPVAFGVGVALGVVLGLVL